MKISPPTLTNICQIPKICRRGSGQSTAVGAGTNIYSHGERAADGWRKLFISISARRTVASNLRYRLSVFAPTSAVFRRLPNARTQRTPHLPRLENAGSARKPCKQNVLPRRAVTPCKMLSKSGLAKTVEERTEEQQQEEAQTCD